MRLKIFKKNLTRIGRRRQNLFCFIFNLGQTFSYWKIKKVIFSLFYYIIIQKLGWSRIWIQEFLWKGSGTLPYRERDWKQLIQRVVDNIDHVPTAQFTRNFLDKYERKDLAETHILTFMQNETFCDLPVYNGVTYLDFFFFFFG